MRKITTQPSPNAVWTVEKKHLSLCSSQTSNVFDAEVSVNHQVITMVCKFPPEWGRRGWRGLGRDWIRMATHVAQLLLKGLFITVMSHLASGPLLSPSSILTRPHLNNGPDAQTVLRFVFVRICVGGVGAEFQIPLIFRPASLSIKAAITT